MRITRLVAGVATAGLLGITPIALSAPAQATENLTTTTTVELPYAGPVATYGDKVTIRGAVTGSNGLSASGGTVTLYQITASNSAGTPIATVAASGYLAFPEVTVRENSAFKAVYSGYGATSTYENTYAASESAPVGLPVARKLTIKNPRGTFIKGKVKPKYKKGKVVIKKKVGKRWKKFRTLKTNKKSSFSTTLPAPRRGKWKWQIIVPGNKKFATAISGGQTYSYRTVAPRVNITR